MTPPEAPGSPGATRQTLPALTQAAKGVVAIDVLRELLLWSIATRPQLDRWEACVAKITLLEVANKRLPGPLIWETSTERHLIFVTAGNMVRALDLVGPEVVDQHLKDTLRVVRNLLEHWDDYMPIFNTRPRRAIPAKGSPAGTWFTESHPEGGSPFSIWAWSSQVGPKLLQTMPASHLRDALDAVDLWVVEQQPSFAEFIPPAVSSPWYGPESGRDQWWPKSPTL